jgi:hypothetical protein
VMREDQRKNNRAARPQQGQAARGFIASIKQLRKPDLNGTIAAQ